MQFWSFFFRWGRIRWWKNAALGPTAITSVLSTDYWEQYIAAVMSLLQSRWERRREPNVKEVHLDNVWVSPRMANRGRDRPDQTPGSTDRGGRTPGEGKFYLMKIPLYCDLVHSNIILHSSALFTKHRAWCRLWVDGGQSDIRDLPPWMCREGDSSSWQGRSRKNSVDVPFRTAVGKWTRKFTRLKSQCCSFLLLVKL